MPCVRIQFAAIPSISNVKDYPVRIQIHNAVNESEGGCRDINVISCDSRDPISCDSRDPFCIRLHANWLESRHGNTRDADIFLTRTEVQAIVEHAIKWRMATIPGFDEMTRWMEQPRDTVTFSSRMKSG